MVLYKLYAVICCSPKVMIDIALIRMLYNIIGVHIEYLAQCSWCLCTCTCIYCCGAPGVLDLNNNIMCNGVRLLMLLIL